MITEINQIDDAILNMAKDVQNGRSRGGMASKLNAAKDASEAGIEVVIAHGRRAGIVSAIQRGDQVGTKVGAQ